MLALAAAVRTGLAPIDEVKLTRAFRHYRQCFQIRPHFGQVSWLTQCCHAWWRVRPDTEFADFAFEIADWICGYQERNTGAFLNDHQPDTPGYTSALYLEALGAAAQLARSLGDDALHRDYLDRCRRGLQFLDSLIIQQRDRTLVPNPARAIGGVRRSARGSEIRTDFVQHALAALLGIADASDERASSSHRRQTCFISQHISLISYGFNEWHTAARNAR